MKRIILLLTIMAACLQGHAQIMDKRTANWVFGFRAGLTWNTTRSMTCTGLAGTPDAVLNDLPTSFERPFNNYEGCFTMSDKNGKLLLYSDGSTLRDMNGNQYANGDYLGGNLTSSQSGIFIPYPGNSNKYIMVCVGSSTISPGALVYHEVDVSKKSITKKNQKFTGMQGIPSENVAAILQQNGVDYWIAIPGRSYTSGTPSYINTWALTEDGVSKTPVTTPFNHVFGGAGESGYFKISPDGTHFVIPTFNDGRFIYGDFDTSTGQASNIKTEVFFSSYAYGAEFTPDGSILYVNTAHALHAFKTEELYSDLSFNSVPIRTIALKAQGESALVLDPFGKKIYMNRATSYPGQNIRIIDNIEDFDNFKIYEASLLASGTEGRAGLPSFPASFFTPRLDIRNLSCTGNDLNYNVEISMAGSAADLPVKLVWNFGDGTPTVDQAISASETKYSQAHNYAAKGTYIITITPYRSNGTALKVIKTPVKVEDCDIKTNRMIRIDMQNTVTKQINR